MLRTANALAGPSRAAATRAFARTPAIAAAALSSFPTSSPCSSGSASARLASPRRPHLPPLAQAPARSFSTSTPARQAEPLNQEFNLEDVERVTDEVDVCIVGAGPAGLSAAIRLMKLAQDKGEEIRVVVLEKGAEVGEPPRLHGRLSV